MQLKVDSSNEDGGDFEFARPFVPGVNWFYFDSGDQAVQFFPARVRFPTVTARQ